MGNVVISDACKRGVITTLELYEIDKTKDHIILYSKRNDGTQKKGSNYSTITMCCHMEEKTSNLLDCDHLWGGRIRKEGEKRRKEGEKDHSDGFQPAFTTFTYSITS